MKPLIHLAALAIVAASPAAPKTFAEALFHVPALVSLFVAALLVFGHVRGAAPRAAPAVVDAPASRAH